MFHPPFRTLDAHVLLSLPPQLRSWIDAQGAADRGAGYVTQRVEGSLIELDAHVLHGQRVLLFAGILAAEELEGID